MKARRDLDHVVRDPQGPGYKVHVGVPQSCRLADAKRGPGHREDHHSIPAVDSVRKSLEFDRREEPHLLTRDPREANAFRRVRGDKTECNRLVEDLVKDREDAPDRRRREPAIGERGHPCLNIGWANVCDVHPSKERQEIVVKDQPITSASRRPVPGSRRPPRLANSLTRWRPRAGSKRTFGRTSALADAIAT